jgi:DNA polymerase III subunit gamma/tau
MSLATKYRPATFDDLIGQDHVVDTIRGMLRTGRINQTLLIHGPWGSGKTSTARLLARYLNCSAPDRQIFEEPCGQCQACRYSNDVEEVNAASVGGIDTIRSIIARAEMQPISGGRYNIFVLDEAHQLTKQAVQALLKITEEPPPACLFVLCTTDPQRFPPALSSRCIKLDIQKVEPELTARLLVRVVEGEQLSRDVYTDDVLMAIALAVDGHPRDAVTTLEAVIARVESTNTDAVDNIPGFITSIVKEEAGERPEAMVGRYLLGIYGGRFTTPIDVLKRVHRHGDFINHVIRFHSHTLYFTFGRKLREPDYEPWYRKLEEQSIGKGDVDRMIDLMNLFVLASERLHGYQTDGYYDVMNVTLQAVRICKSA